MAEIKARLSQGWTKICQCLIILSILMSNCNELKTSKYSFVNLAPSSILVEASDNSNNSTQETRSNNDYNIVDIKHRDDEILPIDLNRSHLSVGIRNLLASIINPFFPTREREQVSLP